MQGLTCYNSAIENARAVLSTPASVADSVTELKENETDVAQPTIHPSAHLLQEQVWTLNLERSDKFVLLAIARLSVGGVVELPSGSFDIAFITGYNRSAVSRIILRLVKAGVLIVEREAKRALAMKFIAPVYRIEVSACKPLTPFLQRLNNPIKTKRELIEKHNATCAYCRRVGTKQTDPDGKTWQVDRITPRAKGGGYESENITLACASCNRRKNKK